MRQKWREEQIKGSEQFQNHLDQQEKKKQEEMQNRQYKLKLFADKQKQASVDPEIARYLSLLNQFLGKKN